MGEPPNDDEINFGLNDSLKGDIQYRKQPRTEDDPTARVIFYRARKKMTSKKKKITMMIDAPAPQNQNRFPLSKTDHSG